MRATEGFCLRPFATEQLAFVSFTVAFVLSPLTLLAQPQSVERTSVHAVDRVLATSGSITLRNMSLSDALFTISETWQVNLLFAQDVTGNVNGVYRDVTLREVLDSLLLANGYGYRPKGQSLIIMKLEELGDMNAMLKTEAIDLPRTRSEDVLEAAKMFLSPQGKLQSVASLDSAMIRDYPENIQKVREFVASVQAYAKRDLPERSAATTLTPVPSIDQPFAQRSESGDYRSIAYLSPRHTTAESLRETFETFLGPEAKVVVVDSENRLAIIDRPEGIRLAHQILEELDIPREQVQITALIYDVSVGELESLGVNWTHNAKARLGAGNTPRHSFGGKFGPLNDPTQGAFTIGNAVDAAAETAASAATTGAASITTLNRYFDLNAVISALETTEGARLLADPSVTVLDREEANIRIVTEVPIQQLTQTAEGGNIGTTSFREAGVTLTVTPQIGGDGTITLQVSPTFSVLSGFNEGQPIIDSREATTTVRVAAGETIVIGGLRQRSEVETITGIPKLMKWKRIGKLFRSHATTVRESELIVFLRPSITTVNNIGSERQAAGLCAAHRALERLNWPGDHPNIPSCNDPNCPNHCPRSRFINPNQTFEPVLHGRAQPLQPEPDDAGTPEFDSFDQMLKEFPQESPPDPMPPVEMPPILPEATDMRNMFDKQQFSSANESVTQGTMQLVSHSENANSTTKTGQAQQSAIPVWNQRLLQWPVWLRRSPSLNRGADQGSTSFPADSHAGSGRQ